MKPENLDKRYNNLTYRIEFFILLKLIGINNIDNIKLSILRKLSYILTFLINEDKTSNSISIGLVKTMVLNEIIWWLNEKDTFLSEISSSLFNYSEDLNNGFLIINNKNQELKESNAMLFKDFISKKYIKKIIINHKEQNIEGFLDYDKTIEENFSLISIFFENEGKDKKSIISDLENSLNQDINFFFLKMERYNLNIKRLKDVYRRILKIIFQERLISAKNYNEYMDFILSKNYRFEFNKEKISISQALFIDYFLKESYKDEEKYNPNSKTRKNLKILIDYELKEDKTIAELNDIFLYNKEAEVRYFIKIYNGYCNAKIEGDLDKLKNLDWFKDIINFKINKIIEEKKNHNSLKNIKVEISHFSTEKSAINKTYLCFRKDWKKVISKNSIKTINKFMNKEKTLNIYLYYTTTDFSILNREIQKNF